MIPEAVVENDSNVVFTFSPDVSVSDEFPSKLTNAVCEKGGKVIGVYVDCCKEELLNRVNQKSREKYQKLKSVEIYEQLLDSGAFASPHFDKDIIIDSEKLTSQEAAKIVYEHIYGSYL